MFLINETLRRDALLVIKSLIDEGKKGKYWRVLNIDEISRNIVLIEDQY